MLCDTSSTWHTVTRSHRLNSYEQDDFEEFIQDTRHRHPQTLTVEELEALYLVWRKLWDEAN